MKILLINYNDTKGGAAIATYRLHKSLLKLGVDSVFLVYRKFSDDNSVIGPANFFIKLYRLCRQKFSTFIQIPFYKNKGVLNSASFISTNLSEYINNSDFDLVHLNWINFDFISIEDISKINIPIVWTLHDMWAFCGAEHLSFDVKYIEGYKEKFLYKNWFNYDLNSLVWKRKKRVWNTPFQIVTPSNWLSTCVNNSLLMNGWPTVVINNPIDTETWRCRDKITVRKELGLGLEDKIVLFSTSESLNNYNKGFDILIESLALINDPNLKLIILGASKCDINFPFEVEFFGKIESEDRLIEFYSSADLVAIPSRQESLSYVAVEAISCSCPVVAFDNTGIADVIIHLYNGYLSKPYEIEDFANGIKLILKDEKKAKLFSNNGRSYAENNLDQSIISLKYLELYKSLII